MSILIKGMEMPKCCDNCWALDDYGDYPRCRITEEQRGYNFPIREKRMRNCPLVPIPPRTNADRIRAMTDEELTEWLGYIGDAYYEPDGGWLDWLKEEIDNE